MRPRLEFRHARMKVKDNYDKDEAEKTCDEEVDACLTRCTDEYGGTMLTSSYFCAKGCAAMNVQEIVNTEKYCTSLDGISTFAACVNGCQTASTNLERVGECEFGCGYWALREADTSKDEDTTSTAATAATSESYLTTKLYLSKATLNEVAFIGIMGAIILFLIGSRGGVLPLNVYRARRCLAHA